MNLTNPAWAAVVLLALCSPLGCAKPTPLPVAEQPAPRPAAARTDSSPIARTQTSQPLPAYVPPAVQTPAVPAPAVPRAAAPAPASTASPQAAHAADDTAAAPSAPAADGLEAAAQPVAPASAEQAPPAPAPGDSPALAQPDAADEPAQTAMGGEQAAAPVASAAGEIAGSPQASEPPPTMNGESANASALPDELAQADAVPVGAATRPAPQRAEVRMEAIPRVPDLPKFDSQAQGVVLPDQPAAKPSPPTVVGRWRQTGGGNDADFLPGGYSSSVLTFRADGVLEVERVYGTLRQTYRLSYELAPGGKRIILGGDEKLRPSPSALRAFSVPSAKAQATAAAIVLPLSTALDREGEDLRLLGKTYAPK